MFVPGSATAQRAATPDDFLGLTRCESGRAVTTMRPDVRDPLVLAQLEAHEAVHRAQAEAYSTCETFVTSIRSARQVVDIELPAYCALDVQQRFRAECEVAADAGLDARGEAVLPADGR
jgi:hypothetical protein